MTINGFRRTWRHLSGYYWLRKGRLAAGVLYAYYCENPEPLDEIVQEIHESGDAQPGELEYLWMWAQGVGR